jgi:hypothetical protein
MQDNSRRQRLANDHSTLECDALNVLLNDIAARRRWKCLGTNSAARDTPNGSTDGATNYCTGRCTGRCATNCARGIGAYSVRVPGKYEGTRGNNSK